MCIRDSEWDRTHHAENFDQIDSRAYLVHSWLKYPKFGHAAATDYTARYIRYGLMTREEAIPVIKQRDGALDPLCVRDFCEFCGYKMCIRDRSCSGSSNGWPSPMCWAFTSTRSSRTRPATRG